MSRNLHRLAIALALLPILGLGLLTVTHGQFLGFGGGERTLERVEEDIAGRFKSIAHVKPDELADRLKAAPRLVLFDVRETDEYAVSRLPGAIRVDPGISAAEFLRQHRAALAGKEVVFYCSVGERSSRLADAVKAQALAAGARTIANLRGGIFAWHNQSRPLADGKGETRYVHPFDGNWGKLVRQRELTRMTPIP